MSTLVAVDHFIGNDKDPIVDIQIDTSQLVKDGEGFWLEIRLHTRQPQVYESPEIVYKESNYSVLGGAQAQWSGPHSERRKDAS